ncbi:CHAP domain-containing protein [uncultured Jatrophihabitans sp.]|uniref:CHAP domain-containing protein n=1 Tax=uncultured Jatrophihabitans sp. TaxID=1610747 RepID=UPI0035CB96AF
MSVTPQSWAAALLTKLDAPVNRNNMVSVLAWEEAEGGHFHNGAHWNPLNTTLDSAKYGKLPGNSAGVAVYPDYQTGLRETASTLRESDYAGVLHDLRSGAAPAKTTAAVAASPWGTWHGSSPAPNVQTAAAQVREHPGWITDQQGGGKHHDPKHHNQHHKHDGPPNPGAPSTRHDMVVLDLPELDRLRGKYQHASTDIAGVRAQLTRTQLQLAAPIASLSEDYLRDNINGLFEWLTAAKQSLDSNARQLNDISEYCRSIHTLAEKADAHGPGHGGPGVAQRFVKENPRPKHAPQGWEAVVAALHGGRIERTEHSAPKGASRRAEAVVKLAKTQHTEETYYDRTKYGAWFGDNGVAWCGIYVSWVFAHAGTPLPPIDGPRGFDSVSNAIKYASAHHQLEGEPHVGDIFLYKDGQHTGIVTKVNADGSFQTSEGNAGPGDLRVVQGHRANDGTYDFWKPYPKAT